MLPANRPHANFLISAPEVDCACADVVAVLFPVTMIVVFPGDVLVGVDFKALVLVEVAFVDDIDFNVAVDSPAIEVDGFEVLAAEPKLEKVVVIAEDTNVAVLVELSHGATTHCKASALSINLPFCLVGVRLRTYEVLKLPAAQAMYPRNTSEF